MYKDKFYYVYGMQAQSTTITCIDTATGNVDWSKNMNLSKSSGVGSSWEPEGIKIYNYRGNDTMFIGFYGHGIYYFASKNAGASQGSGNIIASCQAVRDLWLPRNMHYSLDGLTGDVDYALNKQKKACCGTYVAAVLYHSGVLTKSQIGSGFNAVQSWPKILKDAGWTQVTSNIKSWSQAQPGDVLIQYSSTRKASRHIMIYAGDGKVWDERTCVTSSTGEAPTKTPRRHSWSLNQNCQVWRKK